MPPISNMKAIYSTITAFLVAGTLSAQVFNKPPAGGGQSGGGDTTIIQKSNKKPKSGLLGGDIPLFDPSSEVVVWDGKAWNIDNNRLLSATFEAYLAEPAQDSEADKEYYSIMKRITDILSPLNQDKDQVRQAVVLLPQAATYPQDANQCEALLNAVFRVYLAQRNIAAIDQQIEDMKASNANLIWKGDMKAGEGKLSGGGGSGASSQRSNSKRPPAKGAGFGTGGDGTGTRSLAYEDIVLRLNIARAQSKLLEASTRVRLIQAKTEYHIMLGHLFMQRRFEHTVIACRFYDQLFKDGQATLKLKKNSDIGRIFGEGLGGNPTVGTVYNFANESINRVKSGVKAFQYHIARDEMYSAYKRLQEAFMIGQYMPEVRTLPLEQKRKVQLFARNMFQLTAALEVKDFERGQQLIDGLKTTATDFDTTKAQAYVTTNMKVSNMHIAKAGLLFSDGKTDDAETELRQAAEIWPTNPKLEEVMTETGDQLLEKNRLIKDFDRLVAEKNHREIYNRKGEFLGVVAMTKDVERQKVLEKILTDMLTIETAIEESRRLEESVIPGAVYAAWEAIQELVVEYPDDAPLRIRAEQLSRKSSEFVSSLQRASDAAKSGSTGSALAWLMEARMIYPDSKRAKEGIRRLVDRVLPDEGDLFDAPVDLETPASPRGNTNAAPASRPATDPFN